MPRSTFRGSPFSKLQRTDYDFDPTRGWLYRYHYTGMSPNAMAALQNDFVRAGIACRLSVAHEQATLEVEDSTQQFTLDTWQILGNDERKDLFTHPYVIKNASAGQVTAIRFYLDNEASSDIAFAAPTAAEIAAAAASGITLADLTPLAGSAIQRFYELYQLGTTEFENDAYGGGYVLRHTTNAPNRWNRNISDFGVGKLYTTAQLLTEGQNSLWINPLPGRLSYKISVIPAPAFVANYLWSWKKGRSSESTAANNRVEICQEYTLEQWETDIYTPF